MTASTLPQDGSRHVPVLAVIGFVVAMVGAIAVAFPIIERVDTILPATVMSAFSVFSFFHCGGRVVNASSVASYGVFMFIGFPAIFAALGLYDRQQAFTPNSLLIVLILAFIFLALLVLISATGGPDNSSVGRISDPSVESRVLRLSLLVLLCALGAHVLGASHVASGFSWLAILGGAVLTFWSDRVSTRIRGVSLMLVTFFVETGLSLGGFGRLNLAVLALSVVVVASVALKSKWLKWGTVLATGPVLVVLINQRLLFLEEQRSGSVDQSEGVGSVVGPFQSAATITEASLQGMVDLAWGKTIFNAVVIWVPRVVWPEKPIGFGREIVQVTQPWLTSNTAHSDAGTFVGEAVWNFGVWGAPVYFIGLILGIRLLDRRIQTLGQGDPHVGALLRLMTAAMLSGTLLNIVWGSISTAAARTLLPLAVLLAVRFVHAAISSRVERQSGRKTAVKV